MDPENTNPDTTAPVAATTDQPASPPAPEKPAGFSQEDVNRIVAKRLEEDRARRPVAPAPKPAPVSTAKPAPEQTDLASVVAEMQRKQDELVQRLDYSSRATKLGLDEAKAAALFPVYQANPDGFDSVISALGIKAHQPAAPAASIATQPEAPRPAPAAAPSAPTSANLPMQNGQVDIFSMTPAQHRAMGPEWMKQQLSTLWRIGEDAQGKPQKPKLPSQRK